MDVRDISLTRQEAKEVVDACLHQEILKAGYAEVFTGDDNWRSLPVPSGDMFAWDEGSTYVRRPPYFDGMPRQPEPLRDITGARVLAHLGCRTGMILHCTNRLARGGRRSSRC